MSNGKAPKYNVRHAQIRPRLKGDWDGEDWQNVEELTVAHFLPAGSDHRPLAQAKLLYGDRQVYGIFRVGDRYVRCTHTEYLSNVYEDACVEFFVQPRAGMGYFNFEMNCGGAMLASYIEDPTRIHDPERPNDEFAKFTRLPAEWAAQVRLYHSLPETVEPEIADPITWTVEFHIPLELFEAYVGPLGDLPGQTWHANFNKCAETNSHPHWATWAPIGDKLDFHQPDRFAPIHFVA
ncbi:MAG: hypothetical protein QG656_425 [Candidatus Hydrogenedentes bacterium]|nr:hypothetical protein [Candidatus Hydrogenedentota bacterium]